MYITGERNTRPSGTLLPRPSPITPYYGLKHHTLALHKTKQAIILLRNLFYFLLARSRIVPTLTTLSAASLG